MKRTRLLKYVALGLVAAIAATFVWHPARKHGQARDYAEIAREGVLRAVTEYNSFGYHAEGDSAGGYYYELVEAFAREHGMQAEVTPLMEFGERLKGLSEGKYDLIAYGMPVTTELKDSLLFTLPVLLNRQVLVQRKEATHEEEKADKGKRHVSDTKRTPYIHSSLDLAGKTLHVVKDSPVKLRIRNLGEEIGDTIYVEEVERYGPEQLVALVAHGDIDYAVCDENIARTAAETLDGIDINTAISFTQFYAWAVDKRSPVLLDSLNAWLERQHLMTDYK
ncbi:MAG: transporter substrate-binding domain-containing protein [Prevotellaceae bacterium]|nr:transporter substrate-binding domain-containing protein [Prevotellaceae bacterium]